MILLLKRSKDNVRVEYSYYCTPIYSYVLLAQKFTLQEYILFEDRGTGPPHFESLRHKDLFLGF